MSNQFSVYGSKESMEEFAIRSYSKRVGDEGMNQQAIREMCGKCKVGLNGNEEEVAKALNVIQDDFERCTDVKHLIIMTSKYKELIDRIATERLSELW